MVRHEKRKRRIHNEELEIEAEKTRQQDMFYNMDNIGFDGQ